MKNNEYMDKLKKMADPDNESEAAETKDSEPQEQSGEELKEENDDIQEEPLDKTDSIECRVKITAKEMRGFLFHHTYSKFSGWFGVGISLVALVMIIIGRNTYEGLEIATLIVLALMFTVIRPLQLVKQAARQVDDQIIFQDPINYTVCKDGIIISQRDQFVNILWEHIVNVADTKKALYVYTSPVMAFIFPKDQISNEKEITKRIKNGFSQQGRK